MNKYQEIAKECKCCGKHVPLPIVLKEIEGIKVCPTTFENIQQYIRIWNEVGGRPKGSVRKHFSEYVQEIAQMVIDKKDEKNI